MTQKLISTGEAPNIQIESVLGDLQLKGWDRPEVLLKAGQGDDPVLEMQADSVHIACRGDCIIRVPENASVQVRSVNGSARFKMLEDGLSVDLVSGSLELRDIANAHIGKVHGDLLARHIDGNLQVEQVHGNIIARDVQGACSIAQVGGNLKLRDAEGSVDAFAGGNAKIQLSLAAGEHYNLQAGGNIHCTVPEDANLQLNLHSGARSIQVRLPDGSKPRYESDCSLALGAGDIPMKVSSGGSILLICQELDWSDMDELHTEFDDAFNGFAEEFEEQFAGQIDAQIESQMKVLDEQMENLSNLVGKTVMSSVDTERIMEQARAAGERASSQAQEKIRRAQEKMERKLAAAQRKADLRAQAAERRTHEHRQRRSWNFEWSSPPSTPPTPKTSVSDEERLMILRMLEQKKITLEQAESLLAALENN
jgi:hypothetical protein